MKGKVPRHVKVIFLTPIWTLFPDHGHDKLHSGREKWPSLVAETFLTLSTEEQHHECLLSSYRSVSQA